MEYHAGKESTSSALTAFEYVCNLRQRLMAKPNFEACEVYLKFLGVFLGNTIFTCLGTRIQFFDIATTRSFFLSSTWEGIVCTPLPECTWVWVIESYSTGKMGMEQKTTLLFYQKHHVIVGGS